MDSLQSRLLSPQNKGGTCRLLVFFCFFPERIPVVPSCPFLGEGSPTKLDEKKESWYPYSNLKLLEDLVIPPFHFFGQQEASPDLTSFNAAISACEKSLLASAQLERIVGFPWRCNSFVGKPLHGW